MSKALDASVTFRLTSEEKSALETLAARRGEEMAERGDVPDDSVNGYLRALIRREAKAADVAIDAPQRGPGAGFSRGGVKRPTGTGVRTRSR